MGWNLQTEMNTKDAIALIRNISTLTVVFLVGVNTPSFKMVRQDLLENLPADETIFLDQASALNDFDFSKYHYCVFEIDQTISFRHATRHHLVQQFARHGVKTVMVYVEYDPERPLAPGQLANTRAKLPNSSADNWTIATLARELLADPPTPAGLDYFFKVT